MVVPNEAGAAECSLSDSSAVVIPAAQLESSLEQPDSPAEVLPEAEPVADGARSQRPKPRKNSLLDRAFEWTGPQHSVLTTRAPASSEDDPAGGD